MKFEYQNYNKLKLIIITLGEDGILLVGELDNQHSIYEHLPVSELVSNVDAHGSGDSFNAGFLSYFYQNNITNSNVNLINIKNATKHGLSTVTNYLKSK